MAQRALGNRMINYPQRIVNRPNTNSFETQPFFFKVVTNISNVRKIITRIVFSTIFVAIGLNLFINTKSAELAFLASDYEKQTNLAYEKIDNINQKINQKMAPNNLLKLAATYSMVPSKGNIYIDVESKKILKSTVKNAKIVKSKKRTR